MSASATSQETARSVAEEWQSRAGEYAERGRELAEDWGEVVENQIRARPLGAVLVAGGVGFAIGWLVTRRS